MKIPINLASQPFRRDRAMVVASAAVSVLLVLTLGVLTYLAIHRQRADSPICGRAWRGLNQQTPLRGRAAGLGSRRCCASRKTPWCWSAASSSTICWCTKGMSWSQLFTDLEKIIPYNVKVLALHPSVTPENKVVLDMTVASESQEAMIKLLQALESSPLFGEV